MDITGSESRLWALALPTIITSLVPSNLVETITTTVSKTPIRSSGTNQSLVASGAICFPGTDVSQVLWIYGELIGRTPLEGDPLTGYKLSFRTPPALSKAEVIYAFDTLLGWQDLTVTLVGDKRFKLVRLANR